MSKKYGLLMILCCLIGLGAVAAVVLFKIPVNNVFVVLLLLLCPLSHFLMMGSMGHGDTDHHHIDEVPSMKASRDGEKLLRE